MRLVSINDEGVCDLAWMWLPTFIGQNRALMQKLQRELAKEFSGVQAADEVLDAMHAWIINWLDNAHGIPGLREYLTAVSKVKDS